MNLEYTYNTYASDYILDETTVNTLRNYDKDQLHVQLITLSNTLMIRLGLFTSTDIPEEESHPKGFSAFFVLYKVTDNERRAAFFFP